jgi:hypothetical protein
MGQDSEYTGDKKTTREKNKYRWNYVSLRMFYSFFK